MSILFTDPIGYTTRYKAKALERRKKLFVKILVRLVILTAAFTVGYITHA